MNQELELYEGYISPNHFLLKLYFWWGFLYLPYILTLGQSKLYPLHFLGGEMSEIPISKFTNNLGMLSQFKICFSLAGWNNLKLFYKCAHCMKNLNWPSACPVHFNFEIWITLEFTAIRTIENVTKIFWDDGSWKRIPGD